MSLPVDAQVESYEVHRTPGRRERDPIRHLRRRTISNIAVGFGLPIALLAVWQLVATAGLIDVRFLPSPWAIIKDFGDLVRRGVVQDALLTSLRRIGIGFALGVLSGTVVGTLMGLSPLLRACLDPLLSALYTVPKLALLPLFLLIFGLGDLPIIVTIVSSVFFFMWISSMAAFSDVPGEYLGAATVMGARYHQRFIHVLLPSALPELFTGLRISAGMSVLVVIGIEFVDANGGIGFMIWNSWQLFDASQMYVGITLSALLGVAFTGLISLVARIAMPWHRDARKTGGYIR